MKTVKQKITLLKNNSEKLLPEGNDIFDFPGVSKKIILNSINEAYDLADCIENFEGKFETIILKRNISTLYETISDQLKNGFTGKDGKDQFNKYLNNITKLHYIIKDAYIVLNKEPITDPAI